MVDPDATIPKAARAGLDSARSRRKRAGLKRYSLGAEQRFRWDKTLAAAAEIEDEEYIRKLGAHKDGGDGAQ